MTARIGLSQPRLCQRVRRHCDDGPVEQIQDLCQRPRRASVATWNVDFDPERLGNVYFGYLITLTLVKGSRVAS